MKSIRRTFATKEDREKLVVVGEFNNPATNYTKDDFMTAGKVGKKFNISTKEAQDMMKKLLHFAEYKCFIVQNSNKERK